jgi:hypothetical protein
MEGHSQNPPQTQAVTLPANRAFVINLKARTLDRRRLLLAGLNISLQGAGCDFSWEGLQRFIEQELAQLDLSPPATEEEI